jgi:hypothetical protein
MRFPLWSRIRVTWPFAAAGRFFHTISCISAGSFKEKHSPRSVRFYHSPETVSAVILSLSTTKVTVSFSGHVMAWFAGRHGALSPPWILEVERYAFGDLPMDAFYVSEAQYAVIERDHYALAHVALELSGVLPALDAQGLDVERWKRRGIDQRRHIEKSWLEVLSERPCATWEREGSRTFAFGYAGTHGPFSSST